jgi:uncharacterized membrane protein YheB (UPF0754 family)
MFWGNVIEWLVDYFPREGPGIEFFEVILSRLTGPDWWLYFAIPITTGLMGWITNIVALKMTFYPIKFRGIPPVFGWQGIIPRKATKIAGKFSDLLVDKLVTVPELFKRFDPDGVAREMEPAFDELIEPTVRETVSDRTPSIWEFLPDWSKQEVYDAVYSGIPELLERDFTNDESERSMQKALAEASQHYDDFENLVDDVMHQEAPTMWESLPGKIRNKILLDIRDDLPEIMRKIIADWEAQIDDVLDLKSMTVSEIEKNREILNQVFQESGQRELNFIKRSGLYFGTFFGFFQMILWMFYDAWWLLPLIGFFVGTATNFIAIQLIFSPKQSYDLGFMKLQGLAYKRRDEINRIFSKVATDRILNVRTIFHHIFKDTNRKLLFQSLQKHVHNSVDRVGGVFNSLVPYVLGTQRYFELKNEIAERLMLILPDAVEYSYDYLEDELQLEDVLRENLQKLNPEQFETLMRTPYKEDEWILVMVGGVLGAVVGGLQLVYLFGGNIPFLG